MSGDTRALDAAKTGDAPAAGDSRGVRAVAAVLEAEGDSRGLSGERPPLSTATANT